MPNDPKTDLIYAILAMDSYNTGYGSAIRDLGTGSTIRLGDYSIIQDLSDAGWQSAGFYALAYKHAATGEVVISYRGTNFDPGDARSVSVQKVSTEDAEIRVSVTPVWGWQSGFDKLSLSGVCGASQDSLTLSLSKGIASCPDRRGNGFAQRAQRTQRTTTVTPAQARAQPL